MTLVRLLVLFILLAFTCVQVNLGQQFPEEEQNVDGISPGAANIILRSIFEKVEDAEDDPDKESRASLLGDWITKRQHPGKRMLTDLEKRQHPGRRSLWEQDLSIPGSQIEHLNEWSKRQHPGKRYLVYSKRQHPGKRGWDGEQDEGEPILEKRQHPGKRYLGSQSSEEDSVPCKSWDSTGCSLSRDRLLLELLDNVSEGHVEEKRQHPGRRSLLDGEVEAEEHVSARCVVKMGSVVTRDYSELTAGGPLQKGRIHIRIGMFSHYKKKYYPRIVYRSLAELIYSLNSRR